MEMNISTGEKEIVFPIKMQGTIINIDVNTFDFIIVYGFIGRLFNILNDLPSSDIIELVIEVIKLAKHIKPNNITGI